MHRLTHGIVTAEAERNIGHAAGHFGMRQVLLDPLRGLDKVNSIIVMLLDPVATVRILGSKMTSSE